MASGLPILIQLIDDLQAVRANGKEKWRCYTRCTVHSSLGPARRLLSRKRTIFWCRMQPAVSRQDFVATYWHSPSPCRNFALPLCSSNLLFTHCAAFAQQTHGARELSRVSSWDTARHPPEALFSEAIHLEKHCKLALCGWELFSTQSTVDSHGVEQRVN
jgi:hypothetical protein